MLCIDTGLFEIPNIVTYLYTNVPSYIYTGSLLEAWSDMTFTQLFHTHYIYVLPTARHLPHHGDVQRTGVAQWLHC